MSLSRQLPFLPGNSFDDNLLKGNHQKRHVFDYKNNQSVIKDTTGPTSVQDLPQTTQLLTDKLKQTSLSETSAQSSQPRWLSLDRKVLRFYCYFKEGVVESAKEQSRVRKCVIYYYLEDDTIHVSEPRQDNSGLPQGSLIKRHRIPRDDDPNQFYGLEDFNVGATCTLYGKTFRIIDCDKFTADFLQTLGIQVGQKESYPDDQYSSSREAMKNSMKPLVEMSAQDHEFKRYMEYASKGRHTKPSRQEQSQAQQFLKNDRKVLLYYAVWDDRSRLNGDIRKFTINFFLADNCVKIAEKYDYNSGRDAFPVFVKKQAVKKPNSNTYYQVSDLGIGQKMSAFGREFLIYDMDNYTKDFYRKNFGQTDFAALNVEPQKKAKSVIEPPPYNGYGTEEDSLGSWKYLVIKPPKKDMKKYMKFDRVSLRFMARMITDAPEDQNRKFLVCFHLADDTLSVFEPPQRNSGIIGGKFLQRARVKRHDGKWFQPGDFYVGAEVIVNNYRFKLLETDERTLNYMESQPSLFEMADISSVIKNMRQRIDQKHIRAREAFMSIDRDNSGKITLEELRTLMMNENLASSEQEIITVLRYLDTDNDGSVDYREFVENLYPNEFKSELDGPEKFRKIKVSGYDEEKERIKDTTLRKNFNSIKGRIFAHFRQLVQNRTLLFETTLKVLSDRTRDALIGEVDFAEAVKKRMNLNYTDIEIKALIAAVYPTPNKRLSYDEMMKIFSMNSTYAEQRVAGTKRI